MVVDELGVGMPPVPPVPQAGDKVGMWDGIIKGFIYALVLLLPLIFAGWTFEPLEFSKQMLLYVLVSGAAIAWLLKLLIFRQVSFVKTPLDLPIGIFLVVYLLASIFSVDRVASFLGFYGSFSGNFFELLFLTILFYLIVNNFTDTKSLKKLFGFFQFSLFIVLLYIILQFFGLHIIPLEFAKANGFNTVGGILMISLFSAFTIVLSLVETESSWYSVFGGRIWRIAAAVFGFVVLLTVNFVYAWAALLLGLILYLVLQVGFSKTFSMRGIIAPLVLLIAIIAFLVSQLVFGVTLLRNLFSFDLPQEVRLDYSTARPVITGAVADRPILGSGPNTFLFAFSKHKAVDFNLTPYWNVRFDKAPSYAADNLVGLGILGFLAFESLSVIFLIYAWLFVTRKRESELWGLALGAFVGFAVLWFAHWFFFFNTVMSFSLWLMLAAFVAVTRAAGGEKVKTTTFSFATSPRQTVSVISVVSLGLVTLIVFMFFAVAVYAADIFYRNGILAARTPETYDRAQSDFERTIRLNRFRPDYYLTYGEFLFLRINQELSKSEPNLGLLQSWIQSSISVARAAVELSPANWNAWERLANLYSSARPLVAGVDDLIIDSLKRATENDANNPILHTELGQVYRLASSRLDPSILGEGVDTDNDGLSDQQEQALGANPNDPDTNGNRILDGNEVVGGLNPVGSGQLPNDFLGRYVKTNPAMVLLAIDEFRKAIELKPNYITPYYHLAITYEGQGKLEDAIQVLSQILSQYPTELTLKLELGRLYYNAGRNDEAAGEFQDIVRAFPDYSDALFYYGLSLERLGRLGQALEAYRHILELNPENTIILQKVQQVEAALQKPAGAK